ncbi:hypothetical protein [Bacillus phage phiAGATE]|uniref:Uncharacterized protein n=1 Tax=Bacillus phage phiAGATE TaxID=1204533 RepID=L0L8K3_9CAUD|nr:hypothetical protein G380_gp114 [Bacillus phage phiAGATE]AGB62764.1 hypothetical protein [Bacillus phage phiAGATE]
MSEARKVVLSREQAEALECLIKGYSELNNDPVEQRERLVDYIICEHGDWVNALEPLNKVPFNNLLYIATGGVWETQKTIKEVLEELHADSRLDIAEKDGVAYAIARLKERGFINE